MPLLVDMRGESLGGGDILRLSADYSSGPGSGPVDLMVYEPRDDGYGDGLIVASGIKAGAIFQIFPKESVHPTKFGISVDWLIDNWDDWFVFTYHGGERIPVAEARVLRVGARTTPEEI